MNKKIWIWTLLVTALICMAGCGKKKPMTAEEFVSVMLDKGYGVSAVEPTEEGEVSSWEAGWNNNRLEFSTYEEIQDVIKKYDATISIYEKIPAIEIKEKKETENGSRCLIYADYGNPGGKICLLFSRIDNTILTISVPESEEKEFEQLVKELGY